MPRLRPDSIAWRQVGDELVVLDLRTSRYLSANASAGLLWRGLERGATREELIADLTRDYDVEPPAAAADVDAFLADCRARDLLDEDETAP
jgi:hypothetical protein